MKEIIDGKLYDTEKADLIMNFKRRVKVSNIIGNFKCWVKCELYQTKKKNWFEVVGTDVSGTELNAISDERAKDLIRNCDPDKYQELYDDVEEA